MKLNSLRDTFNLSKKIGKLLKLGDKTCEELFVGGLLHDIGKIILGLMAKKENIMFDNASENSNILEDEKKYFYFSHEYVGGLIADKWRLPELHKKIITSHHSPKDTNSKIVFLSDNLSKILIGIPCNEENLVENFKNLISIEENGYLTLKEEAAELFEKLDREGIFS